VTLRAGTAWTIGSWGWFRESAVASDTATGTYGKFLENLYDEICNSAALDAAVASGTPSNHVRLGREIEKAGDSPTRAELIAVGPVIEIIPQPCEFAPHTEQHAAGELRATVVIHQAYDQSDSATLIAQINFLDALRQELLQGADGTGGAASWLDRGGNVRIAVDGPHDSGQPVDELITEMTVTAFWPEDV